MLLSFLSDIKNFTIGSVHGGLRRAGRWGGWALGYHGDVHTHRGQQSGQFDRFKLGGLLAPALVLSILAAPTISMGAPAMIMGAYAAGVVGLAALGGVVGFLVGGVNELQEGRLARREWQDQLSQQHDASKIEGLHSQLKALDAQKTALLEKAAPIQQRMETRRERGGHVDKLLQERAAASAHKGIRK